MKHVSLCKLMKLNRENIYLKVFIGFIQKKSWKKSKWNKKWFVLL